jgi:hypothetical protein
VPSSQTDAETDVTDEPTQPEADEDTEPEQPAEPTLESALEKQRAIDKGDDSVVLTGAELRLLREHERAETNRRNDLQRKQEEQRQASAALAKKYDEAIDSIAAEIQSQLASLRKYGELDEFMQNASRDRLANLVNGLKGSAEDIVLKPHLQRQRDILLGAYGANPSTDTLKAINDLQSQEQILSYAYQMGEANGRVQGLPDGMVAVTKKYKEDHDKADKAAEGSKNPTSVPPAGRPSPQGRYASTADLDKAYGNGEIDAPTYRNDYKRLTGREP